MIFGYQWRVSWQISSLELQRFIIRIPLPIECFLYQLHCTENIGKIARFVSNFAKLFL